MTKKVMLPVLALCLCAVLLAGCASALPEGFDGDAINANGNEAIGYMNEQAFDKLIPLFAPDRQGGLSAEVFREKFSEVLNKVGAYKSAGQSELQSTENEETGEQVAVAQVMLTYENGQLYHSLYFNKDSQLLSYQLGIVEEQ